MARRTQTINGTAYVYDEIDTHWVADKKYGTRKRKYIGKMVDGLFVPNKNYLLQQALDTVQHKESDRGTPNMSQDSLRHLEGVTT
jgi:hypothetical protein